MQRYCLSAWDFNFYGDSGKGSNSLRPGLFFYSRLKVNSLDYIFLRLFLCKNVVKIKKFAFPKDATPLEDESGLKLPWIKNLKDLNRAKGKITKKQISSFFEESSH